MALAAILCFGILTLWVPGRWALTMFQLAVLSLAAVRIIALWRTRRRIRGHPIAYLLGAVLGWGFLQSVLNRTVDPAATQEAMLNWSVNLAVFSLALDCWSDDVLRERVLRYSTWFALLIGVIGIFTLTTSPPGTAFWSFNTGSGVPTIGPFVYRNQYAAFVEAVLPLAIMRALRERGRRLQDLFMVAALFGSVVAAGSRAGAILCAVEIVAIPIAAHLRGFISLRTGLQAVAGSVAAMVAMILVVGWQTIWARLQEPNPYSLRQDLVLSSVAMVRDRPLIGFGLGTWSAAYPGYALFDDGSFVNQAHNDWIQWAVEGGVPVFVFFAGIFVWSLRPAALTIWGLGMIAVFLHCLVDYPMQQRPALAAFFFAMLGAIAAADRSRKLKRMHRPSIE